MQISGDGGWVLLPASATLGCLSAYCHASTWKGKLGACTPHICAAPCYPADAGRILVAWSVLAFTLAYVSGNLGEYKGDESVY